MSRTQSTYLRPAFDCPEIFLTGNGNSCITVSMFLMLLLNVTDCVLNTVLSVVIIDINSDVVPSSFLSMNSMYPATLITSPSDRVFTVLMVGAVVIRYLSTAVNSLVVFVIVIMLLFPFFECVVSCEHKTNLLTSYIILPTELSPLVGEFRLISKTFLLACHKVLH